jgi:hypothetical protein
MRTNAQPKYAYGLLGSKPLSYTRAGLKRKQNINFRSKRAQTSTFSCAQRYVWQKWFSVGQSWLTTDQFGHAWTERLSPHQHRLKKNQAPNSGGLIYCF